MKYVLLHLGVEDLAQPRHEPTRRQENDCEKRKHLQTVKKKRRNEDTQTDKDADYEREREKKRFLMVCCCITDVLRSCGLRVLSHVAVRDVSLSLPGLLHCHISLSLSFKCAPCYDAKSKKGQERM